MGFFLFLFLLCGQQLQLSQQRADELQKTVMEQLSRVESLNSQLNIKTDEVRISSFFFVPKQIFANVKSTQNSKPFQSTEQWFQMALID
jgi:hypothetical protein